MHTRSWLNTRFIAVCMSAQPALYFLVYGKSYPAELRPIHRVPSGLSHGAVLDGPWPALGEKAPRTMQMIHTHNGVRLVRGDAQKEPASPMRICEFSAVCRPGW